jgi:hypothetical protein
MCECFLIRDGAKFDFEVPPERANGVQLASRRQADEIQGVTNRGANPGSNADDRGLYIYNPVTVPLTF